MKSKIYSSRYMKVSSKGFIWIPAFVTIGFLLAFPVAELIMLGNWFGMEYSTEQISMLYENLWKDGFMVTGLVVAGLAALFNGIAQFWYLYSPRKIDFYHSLPVKRSRMFWYKTLQSLLYYLVPYLVMEFCSICIGAMRGFFSLHLMKLAFLLMLFHLLLYLFFYFSVVLVICLTGHFLMGALLLGAVVAYGPVLSILVEVYENLFYNTYMGVAYGSTKILMEMTSPVTIADTFARKYASGDYGSVLILVMVLTAFWGILGYCTYVHRKSEKAGQAFVYNWAGILVRFLVVVPAGLGIGVIFYMLPTDSSRIPWWIFGMILGTVLTNGILGIIYYMDFRKFFSHKIQFAVCMAMVALCACVFYFDLTGYDRYLPDYDELENVVLGLSNIGEEQFYNVTVGEDGNISIVTNPVGNGMSQYNDLGMDENIYRCIEKIKEQSYDICQEISRKDTLWSAYLWDETGKTVTVPVCYELKSGKEVYRSYRVSRKNLKELFEAGYENGTMKEERYSLLQLPEKYVDTVSCTFTDGQFISLFQDNRAKREQLVDAFRQDVQEAAPEVFTGEPCAILDIEYPQVPTGEKIESLVPGEENGYYNLSGYFYVYPQFKRTIEILKKTGYPVSMEDVNVTSVEVSYYMNKEETEYSSPMIYDDPIQLEELKKVLKYYQLASWDDTTTLDYAYLNVTINKEESSTAWVIPEGQTPDFMQEDAQRAMAFEVLDE